MVERGGHVVVISSIYAFFNGALNASYAASKAGIEQLTRALRVELVPHGATAGVAYLGFIDLPKFMETNEGLAGIVGTAHTIGGWAIVVLLVLHIGAVIFHQAVRRDGTLLRMV